MSYVIQFTRYRAVRFRSFLFAANFYILAHLFEFVKNFFRSFSNFFDVARCAPGQGRSSRNFYMLAQIFSFVKNFFRFFSIFLIRAFFCCPRGQLRYISTPIPICQALFAKFRHLFSHSNTPYIIDRELHFCSSYPIYNMFTLHHQSGRNRHRFSYRPQRSFPHCPHPGRQRRYGPADSSASPPLPGSWA